MCSVGTTSKIRVNALFEHIQVRKRIFESSLKYSRYLHLAGIEHHAC